MAITNEDNDVEFANDDEEVKYTDVCLFTRVLRKPEKVLRQIPEDAWSGLYGMMLTKTTSQEMSNRIWKVRKALYGSPQAGRRWDPQLKFPPTFAMDKRG
eukprot:g34597.t1